MSKRRSNIFIALFCMILLCGCGKDDLTENVIINPVQYPLTKEIVEEAFEKVDLPGIVSEERYDSAIRTSIDIRDEENRLIAGIASNGDGEKRGLFVTLVPYLRSGAASITLPEEKWEELIKFTALLYGFEDETIIYNDFIDHYEENAICTEYQQEQEPYYKKQYEWLKSYGDVTCQIKAAVATDGTRDIQGICFFNTTEYSTVISELTAKNFLYYQFTSSSGRYENYLNSEDDTLYLNRYAGKVTETCIQNMKNAGYFTMVDSYAYEADSQVQFVDAVLTESEETKGEKNTCEYLYTATLNCEKEGEVKEFYVQGSVSVENSLNGWMVYDFLLSDKAALEKYITGENAGEYELTDKQVQAHSTENHQDLTEQEMLEIFRTEYGWTNLANQQLFWSETNDRVVINYYFDALADEWQMDSAKEYGLKTFVFKKQNGIGNPHAYQLWAATEEIKEVVIQVFCNGNMIYQDIYGDIEGGIVHTESHYAK